MSLLDVRPEDVKDTTVAEGGNYQIKLTKSEVGTSKAGNPQLYSEIKIVGQRAWPIRDYRGIPTESDDTDTVEMKLAGLKYFFTAFAGKLAEGRTFAEMLKPEFLEKLIGNETGAIISREDPKEGSEYGPSNKVKRFL